MGLSGHKLLKGTLILSITGFLTKIIGFFYKIYLADLLGAEMLGIYQLVFPVYGICFTIYGAGIQTAISQVIAAGSSNKGRKTSPGKILAIGILLGLSLAVTLSFLVYTQADWIAVHFVMEASLAPYLRILSFLFPFCCVSACINGYYYGIQDAKVPAVTQMVEQIFRVIFVMLLSFLFSAGASDDLNCSFAVWGLVAGEVASNLYNIYQLSHHSSLARRYKKNKMSVQKRRQSEISHLKTTFSSSHAVRTLLWLSLTLTVTKLLVSFLHSVESVLLPAMLRRYGCSPSYALSVYGILTGMSLSFIFFPSTITNSFAVMLLPSIADAHARKDIDKIRHSVTLSIKYCLLIGLLCTCVFLMFGKELGILFFHNEDAGSYLTVLSWLCPFLYLGTTLTSVINGMEKTQVTFFYTILSLGVKIAILVFAVPIYGIRAYLVGLLISQLVMVILEGYYLHPYIRLDALHWLLIPSLALVVLGVVAKNSYFRINSCFHGSYAILTLAVIATLLCIGYCGFLYLMGIISVRDIKQT